VCSPDVTAILFCASLSGFNLVLAEDNQTNRILEDIKLFSEISNSKWFENTPILLFLNKKDLFEKKIEEGISIESAFPDYDGKVDYDECLEYIQNQFLGAVTDKKKEIYLHVTVATSSDNIQAVWETSQSIILQDIITGTGF